MFKPRPCHALLGTAHRPLPPAAAPAPRPERWRRTGWGGGRAGGAAPGLSPGRGAPGGLSPGREGSPGGLSPVRGSPGRSPECSGERRGVTVKYNRQELQRRLDTEQWIDGRLGELYRGREQEMPDEVNIDELLELETDEERARKLQGILSSCTADTQEFVAQLLALLKGLPKQRLLQRPLPKNEEPP
ncbi:protein phosphatase 1 regulatory subunit 14A [Haemorhous mexicanus]|uniref:protein phosphatase 1 regulatory subunit 14A n=1 Tax=Haemorhous mexicanus TaxID=30427 RepID=UPI0028BD4E31|nr:protein phosphatase 1 regulatory subunit 14A [Haemorhous mexicanus]